MHIWWDLCLSIIYWSKVLIGCCCICITELWIDVMIIGCFVIEQFIHFLCTHISWNKSKTMTDYYIRVPHIFASTICYKIHKLFAIFGMMNLSKWKNQYQIGFLGYDLWTNHLSLFIAWKQIEKNIIKACFPFPFWRGFHSSGILSFDHGLIEACTTLIPRYFRCLHYITPNRFNITFFACCSKVSSNDARSLICIFGCWRFKHL